MEDNLNFFEHGRQPQYIFEMEDNLNVFSKRKTTSFLNKMENNLKENKNNASWNISNSNNGCGTAPGNLVYNFFLIIHEMIW